jgi:hypothetical protein
MKTKASDSLLHPLSPTDGWASTLLRRARGRSLLWTDWAVMDEIAHWNPLLFAILVRPGEPNSRPAVTDTVGFRRLPVVCLWLGGWLQVTCVCGFPVMLYAIVLPCWECADFEAAILHEAGHFLGLSHPDYVPNNLVADVSTYNPAPNPSNTYQEELANGVRLYESGSCSVLSLWEGTREGTPPNVSTEAVSTPGVHWGSQRVRNSVMEAFTQHNPSPCLYDDDVEALNVLYPDCSPASRGPKPARLTSHTGALHALLPLVHSTHLPIVVRLCFLR